MATNRGAYDPRQFLHYPDKDPFSDAAQRRLDELIKDFLNTGIAFANGADVRSVNAQDRRGKAELSNEHFDDAAHEEYQAFGDATVNVSGNEEDEDFESEFSKADKGKGRDEREGPGLKGLWNSTARVSPDPSPPAPSLDDAASLLSDSGSQGLEGSNERPDEFFEEAYENEGLDEGAEGDEEEDGPANTEFVPGHSNSPSSEQEIIYIGDSDEEDEPPEAMSDIEADNAFHHNREWMCGAVQDDSENGPNWGSGSEFGDEKERLDLADAWSYSLQGQGADDNAQEPEWRQSQGKESDDDEGGYVKIDSGREGDDDSNRHPHIQPRRFFTSTPPVDPWAAFPNTATETGSSMLAPAAWNARPFQEHSHDQMERPSNIGGTEEIQIASFESVRDDVHPEIIDDNEIHESGPPPELQSADHMDLISSFTLGNPDLTGMAYLPPISEPDTVLLERSHRGLEAAGLSSGDSGETIDVPGIDLATEVAVPQDLDDTGRTLHSLTSPELQLDAAVNVLESLDTPQIVPTASNDADQQAHESAPADWKSKPASILVQDSPDESTTIKEDAPALFLDHPAVTLPQPSASQRNESNPDGTNNIPDSLEKTHVSEERYSPSPTTLPDKTLSAEPMLLHASVTPADGFEPQPLESATNSSSFAEEDSIDEPPSKPVLLHPAVFDDQELIQTPTHTEARCQSSPSALPTRCADSDIEIHDIVDDTTSDNVIITTVIPEYEEEDRHEIPDVPETLETEEIRDFHPGDAIFSEYMVCEPSSEASPIRIESASLPITLEDGAQRHSSEDVLLSKSGLAISAGSNTPPLSPAATVTNSSSAPDPSIATSDLSTVNQAPVSVVTSASSPPPIHVSRISTTHADIQQPITHVGYTSDDEQHSGDGLPVLPDPRLPPEPTHLGIPVGVVGRSLADDKEERAESMKVEPPRSESEGGSLTGEGHNKHDANGTPSAQAMEEVVQKFQEDPKEHRNFQQLAVDENISADPVDQLVVEDNVPDKEEDEVTEEASDELVYPDSSSDHLSKNDDEEQVSQPPADPRSHSATEGCKVSQSPPSSPKASEPPLNISSSILGDVATVAIPDTEVPPPSPEDVTDHVVNGRIGLNVETESLNQKQNGTEAKQFSDSPPAEGPNASYGVDSGVVHLIPSGRENVSPSRSESISRRSTKCKTKTKAVDHTAVSPPPPPQSIIYAHSKRSPASKKRSCPLETFAEPSKQPRLARTSTATKSGSISGDTTSTSGTFDDKSDVSSVTSSSSAVSRLLVQREKSSLSSSQSPSIKSQPSPTGADHSLTMPPPIRKYVPHNHNHAPTAPLSRRASVERATQPHPKPSASPSPSPTSQHPQPSSTHQTRASCTDHKISLPGPDGLLYFLVPRCSLMNPEVEKDVSIMDCGIATRDEVERAIGDLEAIYLDSTTLGVIRQLAGIQLMREGQVGYLPRPGESFRHRVKRGRLQTHHTFPAQGLPQKVDPNTQTGAGSSQAASLRHASAPSPVSISESSLSDLTEDERVSPSKGSKVSQVDDEPYEATPEDGDKNDFEVGSVVPPTPSPKSIRSPKVIGNRRRKLRPGDAAYKPEIEATESSSDSENVGGKKRIRRSSKRKMGEGSIPGDGRSENLGTPSPKKRKRKDTEQPDNLDGTLNGTPETPHKKARRKKVDDRQAEDNVTTAI